MEGELKSCPLWGGGTVQPITGDFYIVENPRAGGRYRFSGSAQIELQKKTNSPVLAAKLTTWIIDQHRNGDEEPKVTSAIVSAVNERASLTYSEQVNRFFLLLIYRKFRVGDNFKTSGQVDERLKLDQAQISAWLECTKDAERWAILDLLRQDNLVIPKGDFLELTPSGFRKFEELQSSSRDSVQVFIAMWFDPVMKEASERGIEQAVRAAGFRPVRIDKKEHNNKIDDEIVAEIRRSRFVVADFTCGTVDENGGHVAIARGGVYFEAGFALGLGIPVIWTCRKDLIDHVHFDTRQFSHVVWETPEDLCRSLYNRIRASIGERPGAPGLLP